MEDFFRIAKLSLEIGQTEVNRLFELFGDECGTNKDKLALIVHLIMIKNHFKYSGDNLAISQRKDDTYYNKISYNVFQRENKLDPRKSIKITLESSLVITLLKSTSTRVEIQLKFKHFLTEFIRVDIDDEFFESRNRLRRFQNDFQSKILIPGKLNIKNQLLQGTESISQVDMPNNLNSFYTNLPDLPVEILVYRLAARYLNVRAVCVLSMLNRQSYLLFNGDLTSTESIWRTLIKRDFKDFDLSQFSGDYRKKYSELSRSKRPRFISYQSSLIY